VVNHQTTGPSTTHLTAQDLAALRANLDEQLLFRQDQLSQLTGPVTARAEEQLQQRAAAQLEVRVKLAASARMVLADVEAALQRMDEGSYGSCHLCRRPIDLQRLTIVPQARFCTRCQQAKETTR
jgi:RNA polymerase-binding transcription factor DksA